MKMLNICFATEDFYPDFIGGQGIYGYHLVVETQNLASLQRFDGNASLRSGGIYVTVLAEKRPGRTKAVETQNLASLLILVPFCFGNQLILALLEYIYFILRCNKQQFDILHANQLSGLFFVLVRPKNIQKIVVSIHNTNYDMYKETKSLVKKLLYLPLIFLEKIVYQKADGLLFNSPYEEKLLSDYYQVKDKKKVSIYLAAPKVKFTQSERTLARQKIRKKLKLSPETKIVLYVGRLVKRKKVDTLIKALNLLAGEGEKTAGIIIGQGPERKSLEKLSQANTHFLGFIPHTRDYFLASDLFVTTSVAEGGFSLSVAEAASHGLPLIISPSVAGFPIVKEGKNGYIVDPDDPKELAEKIKLILPKAWEMGRESLKLAKQFSWEKTCRETIKFYYSIIQKT